MHSLTQSVIENWREWEDEALWIPTAINTVCPHCDKIVHLIFEEPAFDNQRHVLMGTTKCPSCGNEIYFLLKEPRRYAIQSRGCKELYIFPTPRTLRAPVVSLGEDRAPLMRAYQ